jgi:hypothetical protein
LVRSGIGASDPDAETDDVDDAGDLPDADSPDANTSQVGARVAENVCGNGVRDTDELCDGTDVGPPHLQTSGWLKAL